MFVLGLILPICYLAGITGASVSTGWAVLSITLPLALWKPTPIPGFNWAFAAFVGWALFSAFDAPSSLDAVYGLWLCCVWAGSFWLGSVSPDLTQLWRGLAFGLSISSVVAIAQAFGWSPVYVYTGTPGLLFNPTAQSAAIAVVIIALASHRLWRYIPTLLPGLWLAHSRCGWTLLAIVTLARIHWATVPFALAINAIAFLWAPTESDLLRLHIWREVLAPLIITGYGPNSFNSLYFHIADLTYHPEFVHNDYLQLVFEFGLGAAIPIGLLAWALTKTDSPNWSPLLAVAILGCFYFPLFIPVLAFLAFALAGNLLAFGSYHGAVRSGRGPASLPWRDYFQPAVASAGPINLSVVPRNPLEES